MTHATKQWWPRYQWLFLGGIWLFALTLGYTGFSIYKSGQGESPTPWDLIYLTLQLISIESGSVPGPVNWQLNVARLLIPGLTAFTALQAFIILFREQVDLIRVRFMRDHIVICGLSRKGFLLTDGFRDRGEPVVVIERDEDNNLQEQARMRGAIVLTGEATDIDTLERAAVSRAKALIAVTGDDGVNAEIAVFARQLAQRRRGTPLKCIIHIFDPKLCELLQERESEMERGTAFLLALFNVYDRGAKILLQDFPIGNSGHAGRKRIQHIVLVGLGRMGESLIVHAGRHWRDIQPEDGEKLLITVVDLEAGEKCESLNARHPQLQLYCTLVPKAMDIRSAAFQRTEFLIENQGVEDVDLYCVCVDDDSLSLFAGLTLMRVTGQQETPIVMRMSESAGLATLLTSELNGVNVFSNLHAFGLLDRTCTPELLIGGTHEILAQALHEDYVRHQVRAGQTQVSNPILVSWNQLPERIKDSFRKRASQITQNLNAVGLSVEPLSGWQTPTFKFTPAEVEQVAQLEHANWRRTPPKDQWLHGHRPDGMVLKAPPPGGSWDQLSETERKRQLDLVSGLPHFFARTGLDIERQPERE